MNKIFALIAVFALLIALLFWQLNVGALVEGGGP